MMLTERALCGKLPECLEACIKPMENPLNRLCLLLATVCILGGCGHRWVHSQITDPSLAKARLASDTAYCRDMENLLEQRVNIQDRVSFDPTAVGQMSNYYSNYKIESTRTNVFDRCMSDRGWSRP